jgi:DNA invertase Pin-like site-specific DNA recombinase
MEVGGRSSTFARAEREREREREKQSWMQRERKGRENAEGERNFFFQISHLMQNELQ